MLNITTNFREVMLDMREFSRRSCISLAVNTISNLNSTATATNYGTPEDTGWAKSNWIPGVGSSPPTTPVGSKESVTYAARDAGLASLQGFQIYNGSRIFIVNNVPYVADLNNGSSKQVASGFVKRALLKAANIDVPRDMRGFRGKSR
jgi:hypothetical protein